MIDLERLKAEINEIESMSDDKVSDLLNCVFALAFAAGYAEGKIVWERKRKVSGT